MDQALAAGQTPEREDEGVHWRISVRIELEHVIVVGEPGWMRVTRIQRRVFQQAQAPAMRHWLCRRLRAAMTAQPVEPVIGIAAQVLPGQFGAIKVQHVKICRRGIPGFGVMLGHGAGSCRKIRNVAMTKIRELPSQHQNVIGIGVVCNHW